MRHDAPLYTPDEQARALKLTDQQVRDALGLFPGHRIRSPLQTRLKALKALEAKAAQPAESLSADALGLPIATFLLAAQMEGDEVATILGWKTEDRWKRATPRRRILYAVAAIQALELRKEAETRGWRWEQRMHKSH